jgi:hypothetical protein
VRRGGKSSGATERDIPTVSRQRRRQRIGAPGSVSPQRIAKLVWRSTVRIKVGGITPGPVHGVGDGTGLGGRRENHGEPEPTRPTTEPGRQESRVLYQGQRCRLDGSSMEGAVGCAGMLPLRWIM